MVEQAKAVPLPTPRPHTLTAQGSLAGAAGGHPPRAGSSSPLPSPAPSHLDWVESERSRAGQGRMMGEGLVPWPGALMDLACLVV